MPGFDTGSVCFCLNFDTTGNSLTSGTAQITQDGQLLIGSAILPNVRIGQIKSPNGTLTIGYAAPNITIDVTGGGTVVEKFALQTGTTPVGPSSGIVTFNGAVVSAGTNPVRTDGTGANTMVLEVQKSQALASADATKIGLSNFSSANFSVDANGFVTALAQVLTFTSVNHAASPYVVLAADQFLKVDPTAGTVQINLPNAPTTGRIIYIKDVAGKAATNNITVTTVGGTVTIDGQTTYTMAANYTGLILTFDGTNYYII